MNIPRADLRGYLAGFQLAKDAKAEGVDLAKMSREQYVDYAISKGMRIDDDQVRMTPKLRAATSMAEYDTMRTGFRKKDIEKDAGLKQADLKFTRFADDMSKSAGNALEDGIRVRTGTKDSNSWIFWQVNQGAAPRNNDPAFKVEKSYLGFDNPYTSLTPERMRSFLRTLKANGYNGDVKSIKDLSMGSHTADQIVMHGRTLQDAELGIRIGREFFKKDLVFSERGHDSSSQSYSQILTSKIEKALQKP